MTKYWFLNYWVHDVGIVQDNCAAPPDMLQLATPSYDSTCRRLRELSLLYMHRQLSLLHACCRCAYAAIQGFQM